MVDLFRSALRFSWAVSVFGAQRASETLLALGRGRPIQPTADALNAFSDATEDQLGNDFSALARTLDRWRARAIDLGLDAASPHAWLEARDKLQAYAAFRRARRRLGLGLGPDPPLSGQVERAATLDTWLAVWTLEGLGYALAEELETEATASLAPLRSQALPDWGVLPLHTGLGLALAEGALASEPSLDTDPAKERALERFSSACAAHARPGLQEATFEALGLVAGTFYPHTLAGFDRLLGARSPERRGLLWHGVGRGLYFDPLRLYPGSLPDTAERARTLAPDRAARHRILGGLYWAAMLVNLRRPEQLAGFLESRGATLGEEERAVFADAVAAAAVVWRVSSPPGDRHLETFAGARDTPGWSTLVTEPVRRALAVCQRLRGENRLDECFTHRPWSGPSLELRSAFPLESASAARH